MFFLSLILIQHFGCSNSPSRNLTDTMKNSSIGESALGRPFPFTIHTHFWIYHRSSNSSYRQQDPKSHNMHAMIPLGGGL